MSDQSQTEGAAPEPEQTQTEQQEGPPAWMEPIQERMNELGEQTSRLADQFSSVYEREDQRPEPQRQQQTTPEFDYYDDDGELTPEGAQALIDQRVDERLNAVLSERDATTAMSERDDAFDALREEIPALADDKLASRLVRETASYLAQHGREDVINSPMFVDMVEDRYYREQHSERVSAEREANAQREVVLESATGASQPAQDKEPDWGERIVKAAEQLRPQI